MYVLGESARHATTSSLVIVGLTALVGAVSRMRSGLVDWRTGLAFGALGIPMAYLGTLVNRHLDPPVMLLAFACLIVVVAVAMLVNSRGRSAAPTEEPEYPDRIPACRPEPRPPSGSGRAGRRPVIVPFTVAAVTATTIGKRVADRFSGDTLTRAFAVLLILVAGFVTAQSISAL